MSRVVRRLAPALLLLACARTPPAADVGVPDARVAALAAFREATFTAPSGGRVAYRLLAPEPVEPGRRYPLVVHFHGSGAIGTDNRAQLGGWAATWARPEVRRRFPAFVLAPQAPARTADYAVAPGGDGLPASQPRPALDDALALVDSLRRALPVDTARVYVAGFSMGAAAWHALRLRPATFAAALAIAGVPPDRAALADGPVVPLLLLHGDADVENPYAATRAAHARLRALGRGEVELRSYPGLAHEVPADVAGGDWWRAWLFRHRR